MARNATQWLKPLNVPSDHYVSTAIYTDPEIFAQEREAIFNKTWKFLCHESEIDKPGDFRTSEIAGQPVFVIRGADEIVRAFLNACPHRGAALVTKPRGNARTLVCFYHLWGFDQKGNCLNMTRPEGYSECGVDKASCGLREVKIAQKFGMIFGNLDDNCEDFDSYVGDVMDALEVPMGTVPLEVFHFHKVVIKANWKQWHETNMEMYHEWGHAVNRKTGIEAPGYHNRFWKIHPNGHGAQDPYVPKYDNYEGWDSRASLEFPGIKPGEFRVVDLFPNTTIIIRGTSIRIDTSTPIEPGLTLLEHRGVGIKGESAEHREQRRNHHNQLWGPFGRNLPEDVFFIESMERSNRHGAAAFGLLARREGLRAQDDEVVRAYYRAWGDRMGRSASAPKVPSRRDQEGQFA